MAEKVKLSEAQSGKDPARPLYLCVGSLLISSWIFLFAEFFVDARELAVGHWAYAIAAFLLLFGAYCAGVIRGYDVSAAVQKEPP